MWYVKLFIVLTGVIFSLGSATAGTAEHAYVLSKESQTPQNYFFEFFHNGDEEKMFPAFSIADYDLHYAKAKVVTQNYIEGFPWYHSEGVVIRALYTAKYLNSSGYTHDRNSVMEPGFWAINLNSYKMNKLADIMYKFSVKDNYLDCQLNQGNFSYEVWVRFVNKDDAYTGTPFHTWIFDRENNPVTKFNYNPTVFQTSHDVKMRVLLISPAESNRQIDAYDIENFYSPGEYNFVCKDGKFKVEPVVQYTW